MTVDGRHFRVVLYLGCDLKFMHIVRGFKSCKANFCCAWCKATQKDLEKFKKEWPVDESRLGFDPKDDREDLFYFIPLSRTIPDLLHAMLRITDRLTELFFIEHLKEFEHLSDAKRDQKFCQSVQAEMKRIKIPFKFWASKETKVDPGKMHLNFPSLMGV